MKGIALIVFDESISFCQSFEVPRGEVHRIKADLLSLSVSIFSQSVKIERFLYCMYFSVRER